VRFEKLAYEKVVNSAVLNRSRKMSAPAKHYQQNPLKGKSIDSYTLFHEGMTQHIFRFIEPFVARFTYQHKRDLYLQKGLNFEDFELFSDRELRRCYLHEQILRQGFHPYQWILFRARRARYYKVERSVRGFFVQDFIRKEAEDRSMGDFLINKEQLEEYKFKNYFSDMTPGTRYSVIPRYHPLEFFNVYGIFQSQAWDNYFFNESHYDNYKEEDWVAAQNPFSKFDLKTEAGKKAFEEDVNRFIRLYPGAVVKEGEKFDFQAYYAKEAIAEGEDISKFDPALIEKVQAQIQSNLEYENPDQLAIEDEKAKKVPKLGTLMPQFIQKKFGKGLF